MERLGGGSSGARTNFAVRLPEGMPAISGRRRGSPVVGSPRPDGPSPHVHAESAGGSSDSGSVHAGACPDAQHDFVTGVPQHDFGCGRFGEQQVAFVAPPVEQRVLPIARLQQHCPAALRSSPQRHPGRGWPNGRGASPREDTTNDSNVSEQTRLCRLSRRRAGCTGRADISDHSGRSIHQSNTGVVVASTQPDVWWPALCSGPKRKEEGDGTARVASPDGFGCRSMLRRLLQRPGGQDWECPRKDSNLQPTD